MSALSDGFLFGLLVLLLIISGFFSGSETALMSLNRYRLKHLVNSGHKGAKSADSLLQRVDRLIGVILLGNNFVNVLASSIATILALRFWGEGGVELAALLLTLVILIFSEVTPKTLAALHPERIAFPASYVLKVLLKLMSPMVIAVNAMTATLLRIIGVRNDDIGEDSLSREELKTVVAEAGAMIPRRHQKMLLNILDLEKVTVDDIIVPRPEVTGIDLTDDWDDIVTQITNSQYTRMPVYRESIDELVGVVHLKKLMNKLVRGELTLELFEKTIREPYFVPEGTSLTKQLLNFQHESRRMGLVVDEYGDFKGIITLEDILEEIVGEFTTDPLARNKQITPQEDGSFLMDCSIHIRDINRTLKWNLDTEGPKTLNGIILEYMETIPEPGTSIMIDGHPIEIIQTKANSVKIAKMRPKLKRRNKQLRNA